MIGAFGRHTITTLALLGTSLSAHADDIQAGKYLCVVSHLAGIRYEKDGRTTSGNFKPAEEKFFLTIAPVTPLDECSKKSKAEIKAWGLPYWYFCVAKFAAQIDNQPGLRGDTSHAFVPLAAVGDYFSINTYLNELHFTSTTGMLSLTGIYVADGKCTRI
jgi:hypothetical protein